MNRTQTILAGLLLLQVLLIVAFRSPFASATGPVETHSLLPVLEAVSPSRVQLIGAENEQVTLVRDGDGWIVEEAGGFPADGAKIDELLQKLTDVRVRRPVASSGRHLDTFKVADDEFEARLKLWDDPADSPKVDLIIGNSPNFRLSYARLQDQNEVYEIRDLSVYEVRADSSSWIDKVLMPGGEDRVVGLSVTNAEGSFELKKQEDGTWQVVQPTDQAGTPVDSSKLDPFLRTVASLRLADAVGIEDPAAHGFVEPVARVVLRFADEEDQQATLIVGDELEDKDSQRYVTRAGFGFTGAAWATAVDPVVEMKLTDLTSG